MALLKCKMCGGDLEVLDSSSVAECLYCGTKQTVPKLDNEKKTTLFARANRLRFNCEFDKAAGIYESIVTEFPEEAEAFWGLVLCKFGIEYVDDPATAKKIPTCHRSSFDSVLEDSDFEQTLENADPVARAVYRSEAKKIEELRQNIVEVSNKEQPYDIFICYKETDFNGERTIDSVIAQDVYTMLTEKGYRVFFSRISLEDKLGKEYEPYIFAALNSAKIMLAFGTDYEHYNAVWVKNEWSRYLKLMATDRTKTLIPCYKGIDAYDMPKEFLKLQSQDMGKIGAMQDLLRGIEKILPLKKPIEIGTELKEVKTVEKVLVNGADGAPSTDSLLKRAQMFLEDGDLNNANIYAEKVLDIFPECAEAYLVKLCCDLNVKDKVDLANLNELFINNNNYNKIVRFADKDLKEELNGYIAKIKENIALAEEKRRAEEKRKTEERRIFTEKCGRLSKWISAGSWHTVALVNDGTVVAVGENDCGQCNVSDWRDVIAVSVGNSHTVGLKLDGTAVAIGFNEDGQCDVSNWRNLVAISAGGYHTVGLKSDGTVVAVGDNNFEQCNVSSWRDIVDIAVGEIFTVGLKSDGTVVAVGNNEDGQCSVYDWHDIVAISAGYDHTAGLKSDGTVVAVGFNEERQCNVSKWNDIVAISAGSSYTVGLKKDGTAVAIGFNSNGECNVSNWRDLIAMSAGRSHTVGLKKDGTLVAVGDNEDGQCNVQDWKLFNSVDTLEEDRMQAIEKRREEDKESSRRAKGDPNEGFISAKQEKIDALQKEKAQLEQELANLKGLFTGKRKKEIQERIYVIDNELKI